MNSLERRSLPQPREFFSSATCAWTFQWGQNIMVESLTFSHTSYLRCQVWFFPLHFYPLPQKILAAFTFIVLSIPAGKFHFLSLYIGHLFLLFCMYCWVLGVQKFCASLPEFLSLTLSYWVTLRKVTNTGGTDIPLCITADYRCKRRICTIHLLLHHSFLLSKPPLALIWTNSPLNWLYLFLPSSNLSSDQSSLLKRYLNQALFLFNHLSVGSPCLSGVI